MSEFPQPTAMLVKQGVFMGDHGQDITSMVEIDPYESVRDLAHRVLTSSKGRFSGRREVEAEWYLVIRLPAPSEEET